MPTTALENTYLNFVFNNRLGKSHGYYNKQFVTFLNTNKQTKQKTNQQTNKQTKYDNNWREIKKKCLELLQLDIRALRGYCTPG